VQAQGTAGQQLIVATAADPSVADTAAGFAWQWAVDGGAYAPGANPFVPSFAGCGNHTVSARAVDKDGGVSAPRSVTVGSYEARYLAPLDAGRYNVVQPGRVVPVKVAVGCDGTPLEGLLPAVQLIKGDASPGVESGTAPIETTDAAGADTTGLMRPIEGGYLYNLRVPADAKRGDLYTIRVRPFGDATPDAAVYAVLLVK